MGEASSVLPNVVILRNFASCVENFKNGKNRNYLSSLWAARPPAARTPTNSSSGFKLTLTSNLYTSLAREPFSSFDHLSIPGFRRNVSDTDASTSVLNNQSSTGNCGIFETRTSDVSDVGRGPTRLGDKTAPGPAPAAPPGQRML